MVKTKIGTGEKRNNVGDKKWIDWIYWIDTLRYIGQ
jgi:hypothetical protein